MPYYLHSCITLRNPRNKFAPYVKQKLTIATAKRHFSPLRLAWSIHYTPHNCHMRKFLRPPKFEIKLLQLILNLCGDLEYVRLCAAACRTGRYRWPWRLHSERTQYLGTYANLSLRRIRQRYANRIAYALRKQYA